MLPHRRRAPSENRAVLAEPPLTEVGPFLASNRQRLAQARVDILGRTLEELRPRARQTAVAAAQDYMRRAGEPLPDFGSASLLLAGHQPELFHPGVWVKNFALNGLARLHQATPINLVVDNDTAKATGLRLPDLRGLECTAQELSAPVTPPLIPFDRWANELPYEERHVLDEELFATFPNRAAEVLKGWEAEPLLAAFWAEVRRQAGRTPLLGERFAAARRTVERSWGCHNLEVPVSRLCQTEPFAWFACDLLAHLPRFHDVHNVCLHEYRRLHGIRSRSHPVPDLTAEDGWLEVPLWAWRPERPRRGRLLARAGSAGVELRVGGEPWPTLPLPTSGDPRPAVATWLDLEPQGFKIRSRALTNTLYARLFLGDLFIHGIGGAKYDELTDEIIRRFYGFEPPDYLVLSATLRLPLPTFSVSPDDHRRLVQYLRDLHCNPQRHLTNGAVSDPRAAVLAAEKRDWIARRPRNARERRERYQVLQQLTAQLRPHLARKEKQIQQDLLRSEQQLQINAIRLRRDYAFCLFPETLLRPFCTQFLNNEVVG
jgi:hypothetical protein